MHKKSGGNVPPGKSMNRRMNRRQLLENSVKAGALALIPLVDTSCTTAPPPPKLIVTALGADNDRTLTAIADRILPADELGPGAGAAGAVHYINRSLAEWNQAELTTLSQGIAAINEVAIARHLYEFAAITAEQQDVLLTELEAGRLDKVANGEQLFNRLLRLILEGMFSDPYYGGNAGFAGWDLIGYPGAVLVSTPDMQKMRARLPALHTSGHGAEHDGH
jgi:gluconate 2-dehydrogenase gamma chain